MAHKYSITWLPAWSGTEFELYYLVLGIAVGKTAGRPGGLNSGHPRMRGSWSSNPTVVTLNLFAKK